MAKVGSVAGAGKLLMPELKLVDVSKNGEVLLRFSKEIKFPDEILQLSESRASEVATAEANGRSMETANGGSLTAKDLFTVQMMETDTERLSNNLAGWTLTSITATEVKLAL